jgi:hypothetical protein
MRRTYISGRREYYSLISVFYTNLVLSPTTNIYLYMDISSGRREYKVYINLMQNLYYVTDTYF